MKHLLLVAFVFSGLLAAGQSNISWNMPLNVSTPNSGNFHPRITLDGSGNPLVIWGRMADQSVYFSRWTGTMFTAPVKLNPSWLTVATASWMGPNIASKGDTVYVVAKRTPEAADSSRIFIFSSFNGGMTFNTPVELAYIADSISRFPTVAVDASGNPVVAFMKFNSTFMNSRWVVSKSSDYGVTFSDDVKASGWGASAEVCDCCPGAIAVSGNNSAMLYRDNNSNIRDTWAGISSDNATTFPGGMELDNNNWMIPTCPASGPDGVIVGDTLYSTFMSGGSGSYRTYFSKSNINTSTLINSSNLTGPVAGLSQQNFPRIASDGSALAVVWRQTVNSVSQLPILFTNNLNNSFPAAYDTVDLGDITNTDVAVYNGNVYVVWQDDNSATVKFRSGTYTPASTGLDENLAEQLLLSPNPVSSSISLPSNIDMTNVEVSICNVIGETVYYRNIPGNSKIDVSKLSNGVYFLKLQTNNRILTYKFIKE